MSDSASTASLTCLPSASRIKAEHHIILIDRTAPLSRNVSNLSFDAEVSDSEASAGTPAPGTLYKRMTNGSTGLRQSARNTYNKQKYAKYGQDRYHVVEPAHPLTDDAKSSDVPESVQQQTSAKQKNIVHRAQSNLQARKNQLMNRKRNLGKADEKDVVVDVLYENQRGMFLFGIPKYSSASLLPSDPKPWQNGQFRTAAVDIRNAQVPDPSWQWTWKSWYVDMSRDVDEEGWEYSFAFAGKQAQRFAWHGNHPWFHSFVRRRRWLRMRKRKHTVHRTQERAHELTSDYFTIHPRTVREDDLDRTSTLVHATRTGLDPDTNIETMEIFTIADLFLALRKASVDREKIQAMRKFIDCGGDELCYLCESMEDIMKNLMYQSSRRQLLHNLIARHAQLRTEQNELESHNHTAEGAKQEEHDRNAWHVGNLHKAIHAAEQQVRKLEFYSDIKDFVDDAEKEEGNTEPALKNKQAASAKAPLPPGNGNLSVPSRAEAPTIPVRTSSSNSVAYDDLDTAAPSQHSDVWFDTSSKLSRSSIGKPSSSAGDTESDRFTPAHEHTEENASQYSKKSKGSKGRSHAIGLDGVAEETEAETEEAHNAVDAQLISQSASAKQNGKANRQSVQTVEPIAIGNPSSGHENDEHRGNSTRAD